MKKIIQKWNRIINKCIGWNVYSENKRKGELGLHYQESVRTNYDYYTVFEVYVEVDVTNKMEFFVKYITFSEFSVEALHGRCNCSKNRTYVTFSFTRNGKLKGVTKGDKIYTENNNILQKLISEIEKMQYGEIEYFNREKEHEKYVRILRDTFREVKLPPLPLKNYESCMKTLKELRKD